jgi:hypothetical protein
MGMRLVTWWCNTIGITDAGAIQVAAGVFAGASLALLGLLILTTVVGVLLMVSRPESAKRARG